MKNKMKVILLFIILLLIVSAIEVFKIQMEQSIYFIRTFGIVAAYILMFVSAVLYALLRWLIDYFKKKRRK